LMINHAFGRRRHGSSAKFVKAPFCKGRHGVWLLRRAKFLELSGEFARAEFLELRGDFAMSTAHRFSGDFRGFLAMCVKLASL
jgi:hypothetical protein